MRIESIGLYIALYWITGVNLLTILCLLINSIELFYSYPTCLCKSHEAQFTIKFTISTIKPGFFWTLLIGVFSKQLVK